MNLNRSGGFTLVELLATLAVAAILLGVGVPSFVSAIKNSQLQSQYSNLRIALLAARSESVKSSRDVTVCARASDTTCGEDWTNGWIVFIDDVIDGSESVPTIETADNILRIEGDLDTDNTIIGYGSNDRTASGKSKRNFIRYTQRGASNWLNGSFVLCDDREEEYAKALNIALTGDIRIGRPSGTSEVPRDAFNQAVDCTP